MASFTQIEDLEIWKRSRELVKLTFELTASDKFNRDFFLKDQIKRPAISVMSNIAEGFGRGGNKEFVHFLYNANGSLNELKSQLYIAIDVELLKEKDTEVAFDYIKQIELMAKALARRLKESDFTGTKFKMNY